MRRVAKPAFVALVAVMCVNALAATSASAGEQLFITESGKALLFTSTSGAVTLRAKRSGVETTIKCEQSSGHGFALNESPLARELHIEFSGKCEQTVGSGSKEACTEPIKPVLSYGELGLLNGHVLLLVAPEKGTEFVEVKCTGGNTKISGAVIGEFKLTGRGGGQQYNVLLKKYLLLSNVKGTTQEPEEIELLGSLMKGVALKAEGFLSEKTSEEAVQLLLFDGEAEIAGVAGGGEIQNISLAAIKNGGRCPENANSQVEFTVVGDTCEYILKNENMQERIEIRKVEVIQPAECTTLNPNCMVIITPVSTPQCTVGRRLAVGGVCYVKLRYANTPATKPLNINLEIETQSANGRKVKPTKGGVIK